ncbi:MAG: gliding motility-associated C-terminal domain-containing protein [Bacteroidota bacterium]
MFFTMIISLNCIASGRDTVHSGNPCFVLNKGQWSENILFRTDIDKGALFLEKSCMTFVLEDVDAIKKITHYKYLSPDEKSNIPIPTTTINAHAYKVKFVKSNPNVRVVGQHNFPDYNNYFIGNNKNQWASRVPKFEDVTYYNLFNGIDMEVGEKSSFLKYEFHVSPGASVNNIQLEYDGTDGLAITDGNLVIRTSVNKIIELKPYAYQLIDGKEVQINCKFNLNKNRLSFALPEGYDKSLPLVIDPILIFSSYSGSTADNWGYTATYDSDGFLYAGGNIFAVGYPVTTGAFQTTYAGGSCDIVISKYDTTGHFMIFSTYIGGNGADVPASLIVDGNDDLFILGTTSSPDYPVTSNAFDTSFNGGQAYTLTYVLHYTGSDIVISKLSNDGTTLMASTYFGGSGNDGLNTQAPLKHNYADDVRGEIMIDDNNNIYVVSTSNSPNLPTAATVFQPTFGGGMQDGCIIKMDNTLSNLIWCSYLGGTGNDAAYSIVVDRNQDIYVAGGTTSADFPTTPGVLDTGFIGGICDGYIVHISKNGNLLMQGTYYGSNAYDQTYFVETDKEDNVYVLGQTAATGNTMIFNAAYFVPNGGQFISKINPTLDTLVWSTAFGTGNGGPDISPTAFLVDLCDKIYLSGWGGSINGFGGTSGLPVTWNAFQSTTDNNDYYFMVINDDASALTYASFFGGTSHEHVDGGTSRFDRNGKIYQSVCAGCGGIDDFPTTPGAVSNTNNSFNCNNGVIKFDFMLPVIVANFNIPPVVCLPSSVAFDNTSHSGGAGYTCWWDFGDGTTSTQFEPNHLYPGAGVYLVTLAVSDTGTCNFSDTITKQVVVISNSSDTLPTINICKGDYIQIGLLPIPDPTVTYTWIPSGNLSDANVSNPFAYPVQTTVYTLLLSNGICTDTLKQRLTVFDLDAYAGNDTTTCDGPMLLIANSGDGASTFHWSSNPQFSDWLNSGPGDSTAMVNITTPTTFYIQVSNAWCTAIDSVTVGFQVVAGSGFTQDPLCHGDSNGIASVVVSSGTGPYTYHWNTGQLTDTIFNVAGGTYTVTITDYNNCISVVSVTLIDPPILTGILIPQDIPCSEVCNGSITVNMSGGTSPYTYAWSNGQISNPANNLCAGTYIVTVNDSRMCVAHDTAIININSVFTNVSVYSDQDTIYEGESTGLHATDIAGTHYTWTPGASLDNPSSPNPVASPVTTTTYYLEIADGNGCVYLDTLRIIVLDVMCEEPYIYVPNAFTPNGDNQNDRVYVRSRMLKSMFFTIYDRWGEKVFETTKQDVGWDGTYKGIACDPGVFVYYLDATCHNKEKFIKKGNITLIK